MLEVWEKVIISFDGDRLECIFGDIDVFLVMFLDDEKIREVLIGFVVVIFVVIEEIIIFFFSY